MVNFTVEPTAKMATQGLQYHIAFKFGSLSDKKGCVFYQLESKTKRLWAA